MLPFRAATSISSFNPRSFGAKTASGFAVTNLPASQLFPQAWQACWVCEQPASHRCETLQCGHYMHSNYLPCDNASTHESTHYFNVNYGATLVRYY